MLGKNKKRVELSLPKKQAEWLANFCKSRDIKPSKYISWLLYYKADEMLSLLKIDETNTWTREQLQEIIKAEWIED